MENLWTNVFDPIAIEILYLLNILPYRNLHYLPSLHYLSKPAELIRRNIMGVLHKLLRHVVVQLVEALCYKLEGRGFNSRLCHWNFSLT